MVMKYLFIVCFIFLNKEILAISNTLDTSRIHSFEFGYFQAPNLQSSIFKSSQHGVILKFNFNVFHYKKIFFNLNPNFTLLTNKLLRGNFSERPAIEAFSENKLRANSFGLSLGIEYKISKKVKIRGEFGLSNTSWSLSQIRDRINDSVTCGQTDSTIYITLFNYKEIKKGMFASVSFNYKLSERFSLNLGYLYRKNNYKLQLYTYYDKCGFIQEYQKIMSPSVHNFSLSICYNFSLAKFK